MTPTVTTLASDRAPRWATPAAPLVLRGVTVIDVRTGHRRPEQTVVVVGSRIKRLGPDRSIKLSAHARVVDARGKYVIPGLWDMHEHMKHYVDVVYPLFVANGVTGMREAGSTVPLATLTQWEREVARGARVGPRMIAAGPIVSECDETVRKSAEFLEVFATTVCVRTAARARHVVDSLQAAGADFIKTYFLPSAMYFAVAAAARRAGIPFGGHGIYTSMAQRRDHGNGDSWDPDVAGVGGLELSDSGARFLDHETWLLGDPCEDHHATTLDIARCAAAGRRFRRNGTWVVAAGADLLGGGYPFRARLAELYRRFVADSETRCYADSLARIPGPVPTSTDDWAAALRRLDSVADSVPRRAMLLQMPILAGTDGGVHAAGAVPGFGLQDHLAWYVVRGMTPLMALQTATLNPALALRATDSLGTVEPGKLADLVLLDADPLTDIWNTTKVRAVVANGRYYDRAALDTLLMQAERAARR